METVSFEELVPEATDEARTALIRADVVIGVDRATRREFTLFGMPSLETTAVIANLSAMKILNVLLDSDRGDLDRLLTAVRSIKGLDASKHARV